MNRKDAEAVSRDPFNSVDPLFYLSSFQTLSRKPRYLSVPGFFLCRETKQRTALQSAVILFRSLGHVLGHFFCCFGCLGGQLFGVEYQVVVILLPVGLLLG